ncbi:VanZ family protein [Streptomyces sp. ODS28]|uniref:VanZ family protein n=1 Tax=Streptomyces sp. ODS28 TaxID=3136688 RepID=UPI0031E67C78
MQRLDRGGTPATAPRIRATGLVLLSAHMLLVAWLTLRPLSVPWVAPANLRPFASIRADLAGDPWSALVSIGGGLALLAPVGVLWPLVCGRLHRPLPATWARSTVAGGLVSLGIALVQSGVPGRVADIDDVLLNTAGVALAGLLLYPLLRRLLLRRERAQGDGVRSGDPRRGGRGAARAGAAYDRGRSGVVRREETPQGSPRRAPRVGIAP